MGKYHGLDPKPSDLDMTRLLRTEPVPVAIGLDELCQGVKGQSNLEIAGIPRNIFWYVVLRICKLVQHWILCPSWT